MILGMYDMGPVYMVLRALKVPLSSGLSFLGSVGQLGLNVSGGWNLEDVVGTRKEMLERSQLELPGKHWRCRFPV